MCSVNLGVVRAESASKLAEDLGVKHNQLLHNNECASFFSKRSLKHSITNWWSKDAGVISSISLESSNFPEGEITISPCKNGLG